MNTQQRTPSGARSGERGLTLVELIITMTVLSYTAAMIVQFLYTSLDSFQSVTIVQQEMDMGRAVEEVTADYIQKVNSFTTSGTELPVQDFLNSISTTATPTDLTVTGDTVCFNSSGNLSANCSTEQIPLLRIQVTETLADLGNASGRTYLSLFGKTRVYTDPSREH